MLLLLLLPLAGSHISCSCCVNLLLLLLLALNLLQRACNSSIGFLVLLGYKPGYVQTGVCHCCCQHLFRRGHSNPWPYCCSWLLLLLLATHERLNSSRHFSSSRTSGYC